MIDDIIGNMNKLGKQNDSKRSLFGKDYKEDIEQLVFESSFDFGNDLGKLSYK